MRRSIFAVVLFSAVTIAGCRSSPLSTGTPQQPPPALNVLPGVQNLLVSSDTITVDEGKTASFTVTLAAPPNGAIDVAIASSDPQLLPVAPATLRFDDDDFAAPQTVTLSPPVDADDVSETATLTLTMPGVANAHVAVTVHDLTQIVSVGWPMPFPDTTDLDSGTLLGFQVNVTTSADLTSFGAFMPQAAGDFRMALYDDADNTPNNLVAAMPLRQTLVNGANVATLTEPVHLDDGLYWLMIRVSTTTAIGFAPPTETGVLCYRDVNISNLDDAWPRPFGAASCAPNALVNVSMTTAYQAGQ